MKGLCDIFRQDLKTRDDVTRFAEVVAIKQRDTKRIAIGMVIDEWKRLVRAHHEGARWYTIREGCRCATCGGVILQRVGPFTTLTCGGNPIIGCPSCNTITSLQMLSERKDIERCRSEIL